jgi:hypothetical protein
MTNEMLRNKAEHESGQMAEATPLVLQAKDETSDLGDKSRRDALAILAKHTAYTAPAVVAMLTLSAKRAAAFSF